MKTVRCKGFQCYQTSLSVLFGYTPKVEIICGECGSYFAKRFKLIELANRSPLAKCKCCGTINSIPIVLE